MNSRLPVIPEAPAVPRMTLSPDVSVVKTALLVELSWTWKPVEELLEKLLVLVKALAAFLSGTLLLK